MADTAGRQSTEEKLAAEKKEKKLCMSVWLSCAHMCRAADAKARMRLSDENSELFHFEYVNCRQTDQSFFICASGLSVSQLY